jgi:hypothetical protein
VHGQNESDGDEEEGADDNIVPLRTKLQVACVAVVAALSNHYCIHTGKQVMAWCFHDGSKA